MKADFFCQYFGRNDNVINSFWNWLTFSYSIFPRFLLAILPLNLNIEIYDPRKRKPISFSTLRKRLLRSKIPKLNFKAEHLVCNTNHSYEINDFFIEVLLFIFPKSYQRSSTVKSHLFLKHLSKKSSSNHNMYQFNIWYLSNFTMQCAHSCINT